MTRIESPSAVPIVKRIVRVGDPGKKTPDRNPPKKKEEEKKDGKGWILV